MVENYPSHYLVIWWTIWKERNARCLEDTNRFYTEAKNNWFLFGAKRNWLVMQNLLFFVTVNQKTNCF